jgi:hypothetical protein
MFAGALVGADVSVDVAHRGQVRVGRFEAGHVSGGHGGQQLAGPPRSGQCGDLCAGWP